MKITLSKESFNHLCRGHAGEHRQTVSRRDVLTLISEAFAAATIEPDQPGPAPVSSPMFPCPACGKPCLSPDLPCAWCGVQLANGLACHAIGDPEPCPACTGKPEPASPDLTPAELDRAAVKPFYCDGRTTLTKDQVHECWELHKAGTDPAAKFRLSVAMALATFIHNLEKEGETVPEQPFEDEHSDAAAYWKWQAETAPNRGGSPVEPLPAFVAGAAHGRKTPVPALEPESIAELVQALKGVVRVADRTTVEFDAARAAIAKHEGRAGA